MGSVRVIYWSGTGNTKAMAEAVGKGVVESGSDAKLLEVSEASIDIALGGSALALGCPAMGAEVLEEDTMEPFIAALEAKGLSGVRLALFGSYDWGDGQWMREWQARMEKAGAVMVAPALIAQNAPDAASIGSCEALGAALAAKA